MLGVLFILVAFATAGAVDMGESIDWSLVSIGTLSMFVLAIAYFRTFKDN